MEHFQTLENETILSKFTTHHHEGRVSVTLELDNSIRAPLLNHMFQPLISIYSKIYNKKEYREIIIKKPRIALKVFGESIVENVVSLLTFNEFHRFLCNSPDGNVENEERALKKLEKSKHLIDCILQTIIFNNFEKLLFKFGYSYAILKYYPKHLPNYSQFLVKAVERNHFTIQRLAEKDFEHLSLGQILECVKESGELFEYLPFKYKCKRPIAMAAVKNYGLALEYTSYRLQSDKEIVTAAVKQNGGSLNYANFEMRLEKSLKYLALETICEMYDPVLYCWLEVETDRELVFEAVKRRPYIFESIRNEFKSDREIVVAAVEKCGEMLQFASIELQSDRNLVLLAIESGKFLFKSFAEEFQLDKEIILKAIPKMVNIFKGIPIELKYDKEIVMVALQNGIDSSSIPKEMINDKAILLEILKNETQNDLSIYLKDVNFEENNWIFEFI